MALSLTQGSTYQGDDYWRWWVSLAGTKEELDGVEHVVYTLDPTFPDPVRPISDRDQNFKLETAGWGNFRLYASVVYKGGSTQLLHLDLDLKYPKDEEPAAEPPPAGEPEPKAGPSVEAAHSAVFTQRADGVFEGGATSIFAF